MSAGIKLILLLSLITLSLSWTVMNFFGNRKYTQDSFESNDASVTKVYNYLNKKLLEKSGDFANIQIYPLAIYRQNENGKNFTFTN